MIIPIIKYLKGLSDAKAQEKEVKYPTIRGRLDAESLINK